MAVKPLSNDVTPSPDAAADAGADASAEAGADADGASDAGGSVGTGVGTGVAALLHAETTMAEAANPARRVARVLICVFLLSSKDPPRAEVRRHGDRHDPMLALADENILIGALNRAEERLSTPTTRPD
ncbi:MAG: hypothetical protein ACHQ3P_08340 [Candidatus Limnocylindrales bacterium]